MVVGGVSVDAMDDDNIKADVAHFLSEANIALQKKVHDGLKAAAASTDAATQTLHTGAIHEQIKLKGCGRSESPIQDAQTHISPSTSDRSSAQAWWRRCARMQ